LVFKYNIRDIAGDIAEYIYNTDFQYNEISSININNIAGDIARDIAGDIDKTQLKVPLDILVFCLEYFTNYSNDQVCDQDNNQVNDQVLKVLEYFPTLSSSLFI